MGNGIKRFGGIPVIVMSAETESSLKMYISNQGKKLRKGNVAAFYTVLNGRNIMNEITRIFYLLTCGAASGIIRLCNRE